MRRTLVIGVALVVLGCTHTLKPTSAPTVITGIIHKERVVTLWNDPVLYGGSKGGILPYFYSLLKTQEYDKALTITDAGSITRLGRNKVLRYYKSIDIVYTPVLLSIHRDSNKVILRYKVWRYATSRLIDVMVVIHDSVKIVLPHKLEDFLK